MLTIRRVFSLVLSLSPFLHAGVCYTAVNGFSSVSDTETKLLISAQKDIMSEIDKVHEQAAQRADNELKIAELNRKIKLIRAKNLLLLNEIEFHKGKPDE